MILSGTIFRRTENVWWLAKVHLSNHWSQKACGGRYWALERIVLRPIKFFGKHLDKKHLRPEYLRHLKVKHGKAIKLSTQAFVQIHWQKRNVFVWHCEIRIFSPFCNHNAWMAPVIGRNPDVFPNCFLSPAILNRFLDNLYDHNDYSTHLHRTCQSHEGLFAWAVVGGVVSSGRSVPEEDVNGLI